jgi:NhaP-type Na+/H+ or K+/H+ antiporter
MPDGVLPGVVTKTWRYALIGGVVLIPLSLALYWYSGTGNDFSLNMIFVGGLLAGYLAKRESVEAKPVGLRAGIIGALQGLVWILPRAVRNVAAGWSFLPIAVFVTLFSVIIFSIGALAGLIGGAVGGWLAKRIRNQRISVSGR